LATLGDERFQIHQESKNQPTASNDDDAPEDREARGKELASRISSLTLEIEAAKEKAWGLNDNLDQLASQVANIAVAMVCFARTDDVWPMLEASEDSRLAATLVHRLAEIDGGMDLLINKLSIVSNQGSKSTKLQHSLLLAAGECLPRQRQLSSKSRMLLESTARECFTSPDASVHAAAKWFLMSVGDTEWVRDELLKRRIEAAGDMKLPGAKWWVNSVGQTMIVIPNQPDSFLIGSPLSERRRFNGTPNENEWEYQHARKIPRAFAVSKEEVTVEQFREFNLKHPARSRVSPSPDSPVSNVSWFDAARYCNALSKSEGIARSDWCYQIREETPYCTIPENSLNRKGYRLLTETEWELCCRAGTTTSRFFGESAALSHKYDHSQSEIGATIPVGLLKPNWWGLSDMLGNVSEWCHDGPAIFSPSRQPLDVSHGSETIAERELFGAQTQRSFRGGAFSYYAPRLRAAARENSRADLPDRTFGFRIAKTITSEQERAAD
jgi:formylglycine-generating enzyme required for sulfatase activity